MVPFARSEGRAKRGLDVVEDGLNVFFFSAKVSHEVSVGVMST